MQAQFDRLSLSAEFVSAIDGRSLSEAEVAEVYSKWRTRFCSGKGLSRGEIGCALSHIEFFRRVIANNVPGFVFEDDVELSREVAPSISKVEEFLSDHIEPCLVQLPGLDRDMPHCVGERDSGDFIKVSRAMGAYAYGLNPAGAALLLKAFSPIKCPIDYYRYLIAHYGLSFYVYNKRTISVDMVSESTVGLDRFSVDNKVKGNVGQICYKLWRVFGKTIDGVLRVMVRD